MTETKFIFYIVTWLLNVIYLINNEVYSQECGEAELTGQDGILTSPNYPNQYPERINCSWFIKPPINTTAVIVLTDLDMEFGRKCKNGVLAISSGAIYKNLCGNERLSPRVTLTSEVVIKITFAVITNVHRRKGFRLIFSIRNKTICEGYNLSCLDKRACYNSRDVCDSLYKCYDHSDEINCANCTKNLASCNNHSNFCFDPLKERCDGILQCPKGEDEMFCSRMCEGRIQCYNGSGCYSQAQICDGKPDCLDKSDEFNCTQRICGISAKGRKYFVCNNRKCINAKLVGDGINDCGDFSDERKWKHHENAPLVIFTVVALTMGFIVLACRWHITRRDIHHLMQDLPQFPLPVFRRSEDSRSVACNTNFRESDFLDGGEIYEAFVHTRRRLRRERRRRCNDVPIPEIQDQAFFINCDSSSATYTLTSLAINTDDCMCLDKNEFLEDCWDSCKVCSQYKRESKGRSNSITPAEALNHHKESK